MNDVNHWDEIYSTRSASQVGWYAPHLVISMQWITELELPAKEPIIDVGGGASTLVDDLLGSGHENLTVLDLSAKAISLTRGRLGPSSAAVSWLQGDVTRIKLPSQYFRLWHDRAVFHFLTEPEQQQSYRDALLKALTAGGYFIIGTFAPNAPPRCSGLPVQRYTSELLAKTFGKEFGLMRHHKTIHHTPSGVEQEYVYCLFQRNG